MFKGNFKGQYHLISDKSYFVAFTFDLFKR